MSTAIQRSRAAAIGARNDLEEVRSTIVAGRLPVAKRHDYSGAPYLAGAIGGRLLHNGYRLVLKGPTRRKSKASD